LLIQDIKKQENQELTQKHGGRDKSLTDKMIIPVRCFSCGKPLGHLWQKYKERVAAGEDKKKVLDELKIERYCCRAVFLGHMDLMHDIAQFQRG